MTRRARSFKFRGWTPSIDTRPGTRILELRPKMSLSPPAPPTLRLTAADFDAYRKEEWAVQASAREAFAARAIAWAKMVAQRLHDLGASFDVESAHLSPEEGGGAFHLVFARDREWREQLDEVSERVPIHESLREKRFAREATLSFRLNASGVWVAFELPAEALTDRKNLHGRLSDPSCLLELIGTLEALPDEFTLTAGATTPSTAREETADRLRERLNASDASIRIAWHVSRSLVESHEHDLDELLEDALVALGYVYRAVAWAPDNDYLPMHHGMRGERPVPSDRSDVRRDASWRKATSPRRREEQAEDGRDDLSAPLSAPGAAEAVRNEPNTFALVSALKARDSARLRSSVGRRGKQVIDVDPSAPVEKGSRVRVMEGAFEGATGVVQEIDGKGEARVMLGLLSARIPVKELNVVREGKERPALASSHRRPNPIR